MDSTLTILSMDDTWHNQDTIAWPNSLDQPPFIFILYPQPNRHFDIIDSFTFFQNLNPSLSSATLLSISCSIHFWISLGLYFSEDSIMTITIHAASTSVSTAAAADAKATTMVPLCRSHLRSKVSLALSSKLKISFSSKGSLGLRHNVTAKDRLNKVVVNASSDDRAPVEETKNNNQDSNSSPPVLASKESISEFISQVSNLVKLVDSRDIVELQMKQLDCELVIRKKEAIERTLPLAPVATVSSGVPYVIPQVATPAPIPSPAPPPPAPKPAESSVPSLKSPMAGTFYRSPAPGAPPFVKVGDKVQKGQVVCIVEAMKLMNEIEADQSGTVTEILAEDTKPVSVDTPLLVIQP